MEKKSGLSKFFTDISELDMLLNGEIERWMVWLHPEQKAVVDANYAGPARIGGAWVQVKPQLHCIALKSCSKVTC